MKYLVSFGVPYKVLSANRGVFVSDDSEGLCENFNIEITIAAVKAPWSNSTCEKHFIVTSVIYY